MKVDLLISTRGLLRCTVLLEDDVPQEYSIERASDPSLVGNIYKGAVEKVLPGMEAAFVDIGLGRNAFLYKRDVLDEWQEFADLFGLPRGPRTDSGGSGIDSVLHEGQSVLVRVRRGERQGKGARLTTLLTLAGRYLVFLPLADIRGISKRIEDAKERDRLKGILDAFRDPAGGGFIIRTAGQGRSFDDFLVDKDELVSRWKRVLQASETQPAPSCVHEELPLDLKMLRDLMGLPLHSIQVDEPETYERICGYLEHPPHELRRKVRLHEKAAPLFEAAGIQKELDRALHSKVWLKNGGYLVINQTEALVAIDVNSGKYVGRKDLNDTALKVNLQAAREVVRQIRLRDLGGIIVVDFIDMASEKMRQGLMEAFEKELKRDRSKSRILALSDFGLLEMTRKRMHASLDQSALQSCPYCGGRGRVKSLLLICQEVYEAVYQAYATARPVHVLVQCHPDVVRELATPDWKRLLTRLPMQLTFQPMEQGHLEQYQIVS
jgi:ribonuclease G